MNRVTRYDLDWKESVQYRQSCWEIPVWYEIVDRCIGVLMQGVDTLFSIPKEKIHHIPFSSCVWENHLIWSGSRVYRCGKPVARHSPLEGLLYRPVGKSPSTSLPYSSTGNRPPSHSSSILPLIYICVDRMLATHFSPTDGQLYNYLDTADIFVSNWSLRARLLAVEGNAFLPIPSALGSHNSFSMSWILSDSSRNR